MKNPKDILKSVENILAENRQFKSLIEQYEQRVIDEIEIDKIFRQVDEKIKLSIGLVNHVEAQHPDVINKSPLLGLSISDLPGNRKNWGKYIIDKISLKTKDAYVIFLHWVNKLDGEVVIWIYIPQKFIAENDINASQLGSAMGKFLGGGGGGQKNFATATGKNPSQLDKALAEGKRLILEKINK